MKIKNSIIITLILLLCVGMVSSLIITLDSPDYNTYQATDEVSIKFTPINVTGEQALDTCIMYSNFSGTWAINYTNSSPAQSGQDEASWSDQAEGIYMWNVWCNLTDANESWAEDTNRTLTIDTTLPTDVQFLTSNNTNSSDSTPEIIWNKTVDTNFDKYKVILSNQTDFGFEVYTEEKSTITGNRTVIPNIEFDGLYYFRIQSFDLTGNYTNSTYDLYYTLDTTLPVVTSAYPSNNAYVYDNTNTFNVTVVDSNPDSCVLYLSSNESTNATANTTLATVTSGTNYNFTTSAMLDGEYRFNIGCNDTIGNFVNFSSTDYTITIDTVVPAQPNITSEFHSYRNGSDLTPMLKWANASSLELNFAYYEAKAYYVTNNSLAYAVNVTGIENNQVAMSLKEGALYNFTVFSYDLVGNVNQTGNTSLSTYYYIDDVCTTLESGWNLCGATWTTKRNLTQIGLETDATMVSVWLSNNHTWATCNYAATPNGTNCNFNTSIENNLDNSTQHSVWVYVSESTNWRNRTWEAEASSANLTVSSATTGWNLESMWVQGGTTFLNLSANMSINVTMLSLVNNIGANTPYVNIAPYNKINNLTQVDYGKGIWMYWNGTGTETFDVRNW